MSIPSLQHFIDIQSLEPEQFWGLMRLAKELKKERVRLGHNAPILHDRSLAMLFQKPSLRTRVSFEMGMQHLGGHAFYISPQEVGLGTRESVPDVARVLSGYADGIMARVFEHQHILELVQWGSVPVINGLSDYDHPCQALTDLFTIWEYFGDLTGLTLAYLGDGANNVATGLIMAAGHVGMSVRIISPEGYQPDDAVLAASDADVMVSTEPDDVAGADVVYTDVWTSMGQEEETAARREAMASYQVNARLMEMTNNPDAVVMHCLPAHRGEEITDEVADSERSLLFPQAHNRLHAQKALLAHLLGGIPLP